MDKTPVTNPIWWFLAVMTILWFVWYFTGGPERAKTWNSGVFVKPPAPLDTGESYGKPGDLRDKIQY